MATVLFQLVRRDGLALAPIERREKILQLQDKMFSFDDHLTADDFVTRHHFAPGQYAREIEVPAGEVVVGKIHKHAHVNVISKGRVLVFTEGEGVRELRAPFTFISSPGTKRVVYTLWPTIWTTIHVTDKTDLAEIEADIIATSYAELPKLEHTEVSE
jgi:hypothetical protein